MTARWSEFFWSFGVMLIGVGLLFVGSLSISVIPASRNSRLLPLSHARNVVGGDVVPTTLPASKPIIPLAQNTDQYSGTFTGVAGIVVDDQSNTVLWEKRSDEPRVLASITKLMTAVVLMDLPMNWSTTTVITSDDWTGESHQMEVGERFTLDDLFHIALIASSNDAIHALVRMSGLSRAEFVERMNSKARELHLFTLTFSDPTGLDPRNRGSARDIAQLLVEAMKVQKIRTALGTGEYYAEPIGGDKKRHVWTTNRLLTNWVVNQFDKTDLFGKTGYIPDAGYNVVVSLSNDRQHAVRTVVFGATTEETRFTDARDITEWVFHHYVWPNENGYAKLVE